MNKLNKKTNSKGTLYGPPISDPIKRFWSKVDTSGDNGCWNWIAGKSSKGYGQFKVNGKMVSSIKISYSQINGVIPCNMIIRHTCDNRACVNPSHLILGTKKQNSEDMVLRGRSNTGEKHHNHRLKEADVLVIFNSKEKYFILANMFNVSVHTIRDIKSGRRWSSLTKHK